MSKAIFYFDPSKPLPRQGSVISSHLFIEEVLGCKTSLIRVLVILSPGLTTDFSTLTRISTKKASFYGIQNKVGHHRQVQGSSNQRLLPHLIA